LSHCQQLGMMVVFDTAWLLSSNFDDRSRKLH
jgi:hypothetical protein